MKPNCANCPLNGCERLKEPYGTKLESERRLTQWGPGKKLLVLGERPTGKSIGFNKPFAYKDESRLLACIKDLGGDVEHVRAEHVIQCRPPPGFVEWKKAIECCRPRVEAIAKQADFIVGMGPKAMHGLFGKQEGLQKWCGAEMVTSYGPPGLCTFSYGFANNVNPAYHPIIYRHMEVAYGRTLGTIAPFKWPKVIIEPGEEAIKVLESFVREKPFLGFDIESDGISHKAPLTAIGLSSLDVAVSMQTPIRDRRIDELVRQILLDPQIIKSAHNRPHDMRGAAHNGYPNKGVDVDTLPMSFIAIPDVDYHDLGFVTSVFSHAPRWKTLFNNWRKAQKKTSWAVDGAGDWQEYGVYNARDCWASVYDAVAMDKVIKEQVYNGEALLARRMALDSLAQKKADRGIYIDDKRRRELVLEVFSKGKVAAKNAFNIGRKHLGEDFNPGSPKQIQELIYKKMGCPVLKRTPKGEPSTDVPTLTELLTQPNEELRSFIRNLLHKRTFEKLEASFLSNMVPEEDGRIHPMARVFGAKTGRWSYPGYPVQLLPKAKVEYIDDKKHVIAPGMRGLIAATPGTWLVECDYGKLELWLVAYLAHASKLIKMKDTGVDAHTSNARDLFPTAKEIASEMRDSAKIACYRLNYGGKSAVDLHKQLAVVFDGISLQDVARMQDRWFVVHWEIRKWHNKMLRDAIKNDYVEAPLSGRRFHFYGVPQVTRIYNNVVQATGADLIDEAILGVDKELRWDEKEGILLQCHDAIICETDRPVEVCRILEKHMSAPVDFPGYPNVRMPVDFKVGRSWDIAQEYGSVGDVEKAWKEGTL